MVGACPSFSPFLVFLSLSPFLSSSLKNPFHFSTLFLPLSSVCRRCPEPVCSISASVSFLPSFLPPSLPSFLLSISTIYLSHSSFPPRSLSSSSRFSPHTKGSVSLYYTPPLAQPPNRHTQLFLYAGCLQDPPRMSNSLIRVPGRQKKKKKKKQAPFLDGDQGGALDRLFLALC